MKLHSISLRNADVCVSFNEERTTQTTFSVTYLDALLCAFNLAECPVWVCVHQVLQQERDGRVLTAHVLFQWMTGSALHPCDRDVSVAGLEQTASETGCLFCVEDTFLYEEASDCVPPSLQGSFSSSWIACGS